MIEVRILVHHQQISSATDECHESYQFVHRLILESLTPRRAIIVGPGQLRGCNRGPNNDLQQSAPQQLAHSTHNHPMNSGLTHLCFCSDAARPLPQEFASIHCSFTARQSWPHLHHFHNHLSLRPGRYISTVVMSRAPLPISCFSCARVIHLASSSRSNIPESASYVNLVTTSFHFGPPRMVPL